ncbi:MAG: M57 family metalloprotease, partial [Bacteroidota bacterium]
GFITLGSSGFPSGGNPYNSIMMNTNAQAYGSNPNVLYVGSVIQHEMGHCIGFRHTDYMNRAYSCGGSAVNEGASNVGAILIPGTPSGPDANSWMLACSNGGNRTFNANDIIALNYLYH